MGEGRVIAAHALILGSPTQHYRNCAHYAQPDAYQILLPELLIEHARRDEAIGYEGNSAKRGNYRSWCEGVSADQRPIRKVKSRVKQTHSRGEVA